MPDGRAFCNSSGLCCSAFEQSILASLILDESLDLLASIDE